MGVLVCVCVKLLEGVGVAVRLMVEVQVGVLVKVCVPVGEGVGVAVKAQGV